MLLIEHTEAGVETKAQWSFSMAPLTRIIGAFLGGLTSKGFLARPYEAGPVRGNFSVVLLDGYRRYPSVDSAME